MGMSRKEDEDEERSDNDKTCCRPTATLRAQVLLRGNAVGYGHHERFQSQEEAVEVKSQPKCKKEMKKKRKLRNRSHPKLQR
jgi:hypothetical protein